MANRFSQKFTLTDIFNNRRLRDKLPLINYKEKQLEDGRVQTRTHGKTVNRQVFDTAQSAARPFYNPLVAHRDGDMMTIDGTLVSGDLDNVVDAVYNALLAKRLVLVMTANNADMIRDALKETEKNRRLYGINTKLYLRAQSMQEIEGMSNREIQALMNDIMENIMYGDDFPKTQKKWQVEALQVRSPFSYEQRQQKWKQKVGDE